MVEARGCPLESGAGGREGARLKVARERERTQTPPIKSNNPHVAGGKNKKTVCSMCLKSSRALDHLFFQSDSCPKLIDRLANYQKCRIKGLVFLLGAVLPPKMVNSATNQEPNSCACSSFQCPHLESASCRSCFESCVSTSCSTCSDSDCRASTTTFPSLLLRIPIGLGGWPPILSTGSRHQPNVQDSDSTRTRKIEKYTSVVPKQFVGRPI